MFQHSFVTAGKRDGERVYTSAATVKIFIIHHLQPEKMTHMESICSVSVPPNGLMLVMARSFCCRGRETLIDHLQNGGESGDSDFLEHVRNAE